MGCVRSQYLKQLKLEKVGEGDSFDIAADHVTGRVDDVEPIEKEPKVDLYEKFAGGLKWRPPNKQDSDIEHMVNSYVAEPLLSTKADPVYEGRSNKWSIGDFSIIILYWSWI